MPSYNGRELDSTDYRDAQILEWLYWENSLSSRDISDIFDVHKDTVLRWMRKHDIKRRERIEAVKEKCEYNYAPLESCRGRDRWVHNYENERQYVKVSRLLAVAKYGFDKVSEKDVVHHKNEIKWLDYHENIELMDREDHSKKHNTGSSHPQTELAEEKVEQIRKDAREHEYSEVAKMHNVTESKVSDIAQRYSWTHI
jgi:transposase